MKNDKFIFVLAVINSDDREERVYNYQVCAKSEKQARFFLGQHLGCYFTEDYRSINFLKEKYNSNVFIIADKQWYKADNKNFIGEINLL